MGDLYASAVRSTDDLTFQIDSDNNGSNSLLVKDGADVTILTLTEAGVLTIASNLVVTGGNITGPSGTVGVFTLSTGAANLFGAKSTITMGANNSGTFTQRNATSIFQGDFKLSTAGKGLYVAEGSNCTMGSATLTGGAATISTTKVTANSRIFLTSQADGGTPGWLRVSARSAGTSFTITSSNGADTSTVAWFLVEPYS